jgi:hypothetical protein
MNPQPHPNVGNFCAFIIICMTIFYTYKAYISGKSLSINQLDNFVIGYVEDYTYIEKPKQVKVVPTQNRSTKSVPKLIVANKPKPKKNSPVINQPITTSTITPTTTTPQPKPVRDEQLYNDCINSLLALGYKKTEAKQKTKQAFDNHKVTSIQEFIKLITINTIDFS